MDKPEENMVNAGIIFMFSVWLQGQMSDLVIFKKNPQLISDFVANPNRVPNAFHEIRVKYWEKQFASVKEEFKSEFKDDLTVEEKQDIEEIFHIRNMIAHAHVSMGRNYMLLRPHGGPQKEKYLIETMKPQPVDDQANPMIFKLEFWKGDV
ncbi:MAG: hypothetical protein ACXW1P_08945, partial [Methylophilaceae bacterium]